MTKVLVAIPRVHEATAPALERLQAAGCELVVNPHGRTLSEDELIGQLPGCFATIAGGERYSERVFAAAPELKIVARMGVGYDAVDVAAATRHGVAVAMGFGTNHEAVADMAFSLMAALSNRLFAYHQEVMEGRWGGHFHPAVALDASASSASAGSAGRSRGAAGASRCACWPTIRSPIRPMPQAEGIELVALERCSARRTSSRSMRRTAARPTSSSTASVSR